MKLKLVVVQGKPAGKMLIFSLGEYYLGRGPECHVRFNSDWVSRQHCLLRVVEGDVFLRDLGSRNGTLINGGLLTGEQELRNADQIQIGPVVFEVRFDLPGTKVTPAPSTSSDTLLPGEDEERHSIDSTAHHPLYPVNGWTSHDQPGSGGDPPNRREFKPAD